jgi:hypothetical protein
MSPLEIVRDSQGKAASGDLFFTRNGDFISSNELPVLLHQASLQIVELE